MKSIGDGDSITIYSVKFIASAVTVDSIMSKMGDDMYSHKSDL